MPNSKLYLQAAVVAVIVLTSSTRVSAVCGLGGEVGFGTTDDGKSVIVANNCGVIDSKSGDICGDYDQNSHVICDNSNLVTSAQTYDGRNWGDETAQQTCYCAAGKSKFDSMIPLEASQGL
ncbi:hypothetical protein ACEPAF_2147 [Sanghuangporus sanghuang]